METWQTKVYYIVSFKVAALVAMGQLYCNIFIRPWTVVSTMEVNTQDGRKNPRWMPTQVGRKHPEHENKLYKTKEGINPKIDYSCTLQ